LNAFKIVNTTETIGAFVQDRQNGIMGVPGRESKMIPVTVALHSGLENMEWRPRNSIMRFSTMRG